MILGQTAGWPLSAAGRGEESPGSTEVRCRVTPGGGDPRESATESTPPAHRNVRWAARVKRCGKSAPRRRQRRRQGKPHREQDQVGAAGIPSAGCQAGLRAAARVGRTRRSATGVPEEWPSPSQELFPGRDRTRLTRRLASLHLEQSENFCGSKLQCSARCDRNRCRDYMMGARSLARAQINSWLYF
jgi:hypothetical protein